MGLVEVVRGQRTSDETFEAVEAVAEDLDKTAVAVASLKFIHEIQPVPLFTTQLAAQRATLETDPCLPRVQRL
jgi:hypothetical protein